MSQVNQDLFLLSPSAQVREALEVINKYAAIGKTVFVVEGSSPDGLKVLGSITDGDIRREGLQSKVRFLKS